MSLLREKVSYEFWFIDYVGSVSTTFLGKGILDKRIYRDDSTGVHAHNYVSDSLGESVKEDLLKKIYPLLLTASYKIMDMGFEWVLTENYYGGTFKDLPKSNKWRSPPTWRFADKVDRLTKCRIEFPSFMQSEKFLIKYYLALYKELLPFRNQITHGSGFSVEGNKLQVNLGDGRILTLSRSQLDSLMKVCVSFIPLITMEWDFGPYQQSLIRYHLDQLAEVHKLPSFGDRSPLLLQVEYHVHQINNKFTINLARIRKHLSDSFKNREMHFNLDVVMYIGDKEAGTYSIANEKIPNSDVLILTSSRASQAPESTFAGQH